MLSTTTITATKKALHTRSSGGPSSASSDDCSSPILLTKQKHLSFTSNYTKKLYVGVVALWLACYSGCSCQGFSSGWWCCAVGVMNAFPIVVLAL